MKRRLATRKSPLALWQAQRTAELLRAARPESEIELVTISSSGDLDRTTAVPEFGRTGVFTAEVDRAVLDGRADAGVHSLKDLPTELPAGIVLASTLDRANAEDALLARGDVRLADLRPRARVGTGSVRRRALLLSIRPDLEIVPVRGNVETRIDLLERGELDALVMARAGLERLGLGAKITEVLGAPRFLPAVGQGIIGLTCRADDEATRRALAGIGDAEAWAEAHAERALLAALHGGCNAPVAARARAVEGALAITACVLALDGSQRVEDSTRGAIDDASAIGRGLAERLLARGAARWIDAARGR